MILLAPHQLQVGMFFEDTGQNGILENKRYLIKRQATCLTYATSLEFGTDKADFFFLGSK